MLPNSVQGGSLNLEVRVIVLLPWHTLLILRSRLSLNPILSVELVPRRLLRDCRQKSISPMYHDNTVRPLPRNTLPLKMRVPCTEDWVSGLDSSGGVIR